MKRTTWFLLAMTVMAALFVSACGGAAQAPAPQQQQQPQQQQPAAPAQQQQQQPAAPAQSFAPACQASASCSAPAVKDTEASSTYCVQKIPYQNITVSQVFYHLRDGFFILRFLQKLTYTLLRKRASPNIDLDRHRTTTVSFEGGATILCSIIAQTFLTFGRIGRKSTTAATG